MGDITSACVFNICLQRFCIRVKTDCIILCSAVNEYTITAILQAVAGVVKYNVVGSVQWCPLEDTDPSTFDSKSPASVICNGIPSALESNPRYRCMDTSQIGSIENVIDDDPSRGIFLHVNVFRWDTRTKQVMFDDVIVALIAGASAVNCPTGSSADIDRFSVPHISSACVLDPRECKGVMR